MYNLISIYIAKAKKAGQWLEMNGSKKNWPSPLLPEATGTANSFDYDDASNSSFTACFSTYKTGIYSNVNTTIMINSSQMI